MRFGVYLGKALMALKDKLAGLEVEEECGRFPAVLVTAVERAYALLILTHTSSSQFLQPQYLSKECFLVEPFLPWRGLFRQRHGWDDDAW